VEISVQLPTSDGAGVSDIEEQEGRQGKFIDEEQEGESDSEKEQDTLKVPSSTRARESREVEKKVTKKVVTKSTKSTSVREIFSAHSTVL